VLGRRSAARGEEFFDEEACEALGIMADDGVLREQAIEHDAETELIQLGEVNDDGFGALSEVALGDFG
jgi:hypothetical protein